MDGASQQTPPPAAPRSAMPKLPKGAVIAGAAVVGLLVVGGIGKMIVGKMTQVAVKTAFEAGTGVKVDEKGGGVTQVTTKDGTMQVKQGADGSATTTITDKDGKTAEYTVSGDGEGAATMPRDFPGDFPLPSGATLDSSGSITAEGQQTFTLAWSTSASVADTRAYFENELKAKGWRITATTEVEGSVSIVFERGPADAEKKDGGYLAITTEEGKTKIVMWLTVAKQ